MKDSILRLRQSLRDATQNERATDSARPGATLPAEDLPFTSNLHAAMLSRGVDPRSRLILWMGAAFVLIFLTWAGLAPIDEVTRGAGKVIPSSHIQVIQNLEGGILSELLVEEGDYVEKGQIIARLDDVRFSSDFKESRIKYLELLARTARLEAEINEKPFHVPDEVVAESPAQAQNEISLYNSRQNELKTSLSVFDEQARQKEQQITEFESKKGQTVRSYGLIMRELAKYRPLVPEGAVSEVEVLRLERQANELKGEMDGYILAIPRIRSELDEVKRKIEEVKIKFKSEAAGQFNENKAELARTAQSGVALEDRVKRTQVLSPVKGKVNQIKHNTIGGVIQPGMDLMDVVPIEDQLLIEARVRPKDVAFLRPGLSAMVKFTAYDFSIYGGLEARLEHISADTIISEEGEEKGERFYLIRVRTGKNHLGPEDKPLEIIPGMTADVDIITGKKTVLDYLLKPVLKAKERALRER
jgi:adhesin transport system membrane fusion protein